MSTPDVELSAILQPTTRYSGTLTSSVTTLFGASLSGIPGPAGIAATVTVGTTTTLPGGSNATVTNTGDEYNAVFNFGIPRGIEETKATIETKLGSASAGNDGYLLATDWTTFNGKQNALGYTPVPNTRSINGEPLTSDITLAAFDVGAVPTGRTVNGKALTSNISLTSSDVGAVPTSRLVNGYSLLNDVSLGASDVGAVPTSRKVNGYSLSSDITLYKSDLGLGNVTNDAQLTVAQLGAASGVCPLGSDSKVPIANLPAQQMMTTYVVASQAAMLALDAKVGDMAIRTDISQTYVLSSLPASTFSNWIALVFAAPVTSVNSKTGSVTLTYTDVGAVPSTRTVNSKALSSDISLTASDIGLSHVQNVDQTNASNLSSGTVSSVPTM